MRANCSSCDKWVDLTTVQNLFTNMKGGLQVYFENKFYLQSTFLIL